MPKLSIVILCLILIGTAYAVDDLKKATDSIYGTPDQMATTSQSVPQSITTPAPSVEPQIKITMGKNMVIDHLGYSKADPGKTYLFLPLEFENNGYEKFDVNSYNCKVIINKVQYDSTYVGGMADAGYTPLDSVSLMDGGKIRGYVPFEIPAGDQTFSFQYDTYSWEDYNIVYAKGDFY